MRDKTTILPLAFATDRPKTKRQTDSTTIEVYNLSNRVETVFLLSYGGIFFSNPKLKLFL